MRSFREHQQLEESGLSRLVRQIESHQDWAVITAYRNQYSEDENEQRNAKLKAILDRNHLGPEELIGHWRECQLDGVEWDQCPPDKLVDVTERSFFIVRPQHMDQGEFKGFVMFLIENFDQDGAMVSFDDDVFILQHDGSTIDIGDNLKLDKMGQAYSQHVKDRDHPFVFEGLTKPKDKL